MRLVKELSRGCGHWDSKPPPAHPTLLLHSSLRPLPPSLTQTQPLRPGAESSRRVPRGERRVLQPGPTFPVWFRSLSLHGWISFSSSLHLSGFLSALFVSWEPSCSLYISVSLFSLLMYLSPVSPSPFSLSPSPTCPHPIYSFPTPAPLSFSSIISCWDPFDSPSPFLCLLSCPILYVLLTAIYIKFKLDCFLLWFKNLSRQPLPSRLIPDSFSRHARSRSAPCPSVQTPLFTPLGST